MKALVATGTHPSGKVLRTGDKVLCCSKPAEFIGIYRNRILIYFEGLDVCADFRDWRYILVNDPPNMKKLTENMDPLFNTEIY